MKWKTQFVWLMVLALAVPAAVLAESRFCADPALQVYSGESDTWYLALSEGPQTVPNLGLIGLEFTVTAANSGQWGHSSVLGPMAVGTNFADFRFNLHFDGPAPELSIYTTEGGLGERYPIQPGTRYQALFVRHNAQLVLHLYDGGQFVFADSLAYAWPTFDRFQVAYDYYGGGFCVWNQPSCQIDFLSNRGETRFIQGSIHDLILNYLVPVREETWGRVKAVYR